MENNCRYTESDVYSTIGVYNSIHNLQLEAKIDKLYKQLDNCDDIWMRNKIAKKIRRLKERIIK